MNFDTKLESIKSFLANGDVSLAISDLGEYLREKKEYFNPGTYQKFDKIYVNISSRFNSQSVRSLKGVVNPEEFQRAVSQLVASMVDLIYQIGSSLSDSEITPLSNRVIDGMSRVDSEEAMRLAIDEIKDARSMKVIGMGRQDVAEATANNHVLDYYSAVENRFQNPERPFSIKRITQHKLKPKFVKHLKKCFQIVSDQGEQINSYDLLLYGDLKITYTYYIINSNAGESSLFLTLNTENYDIDAIDNSLVFYSRSHEIITKFNDHFDQFWRVESKQGRKISDIFNFDRYVPFDGPLYNQYNEIKHIIKRIPDDSVRMRHLKTELDIFHRRLKGLDDCVMTYTHTNSNQRVTDCFIDYFTGLRDGHKSYRTVSFPQFWEAMYHIPTLIEKQAIALAGGAKMERILLLDSAKLDEYEISRALQIAIPRNYMHHQKYSNFCFTILFSRDPEEMKVRDNFAIWKNEDLDYRVLFDMKYGHESQSTTTVYFANYSLTEKEKTDMRKNQARINEKESDFTLMKELVADQNQKFLSYLNGPKDDERQFSTESKEIQRKIEFMKNMGIDDLMGFMDKRSIGD